MYFDKEGMTDAQIERMEQTIELVQKIDQFVNTLSLEPKDFLMLMKRQHPTNQQAFTRLCLAWLTDLAQDENRGDLRTEASKEIARKISDLLLKETGMPLTPYLPII